MTRDFVCLLDLSVKVNIYFENAHLILDYGKGDDVFKDMIYTKFQIEFFQFSH